MLLLRQVRPRRLIVDSDLAAYTEHGWSLPVAAQVTYSLFDRAIDRDGAPWLPRSTSPSPHRGEVWFSLAERQAIHRGSYGSVRELNAKIRAYINGWNGRCHPFIWTKTADQILNKANRKNTSNAGH